VTTPLLSLAPTRTLQVEVWSDIACPWCYIGKRRFAAALDAFPHRQHVEVTWRSYELSPGTPAGPGRPEIDALVEHKGLPRDQVRQMFAHVANVAAGEGLTFDFDRALAANTFDGHRLLHVAREVGGPALVETLIEAVFDAHFSQGADLGDHETLVRLAREAGFAAAGLDDDAVRAVLAGDRAADDVRRDEAEARALGVNGVPFFVVDRRVAVSGAQPAEVFTQLLEAGWREANPLAVLGGDPDAQACTDDSCAV
jgi:predicted DsbA family dithiol-disulfide isomerase